MTTFCLEPGKPYHCGKIIRRLRIDHNDAFMKLGLNAHKQLRACFDDSYFCRAWIIDGRLAGLGGVTGSLLSPVGYIWLALSEEATHYPVKVMREARAQISEIMQVKRSLITTVLKNDEPSVRFATRLGFEQIDVAEDWGIVMLYGEAE